MVSQKIKLALVNLWSFKTNTPHFGLISLAAFLRNKFPDIDINIIEGFNPLPEIIKKKPDIVGFTSDTMTFTKIFSLAEKLKNKLNIPFIIGGVHITAMPESFQSVFDIGVVGEGEVTLTELLRIYLEDKTFMKNKLDRVKGVLFWDGDKVINTGPQEQIKELDELPYPARDLTPMDEVYLKDQLNLFEVKRMVSIMTSRGCPYDCIFCGSPAQWGKVRFHTAKYVVDEMQFLLDEYQIDGIMFWDDLFIAPKKRLIELVERIKEKSLDRKLTFFGYARANLIDEETCRLLKNIRVKRLIFGLETGSNRVLEYLKGRSVTVSDNERAIRLCRKYGITTSSGFITGTPGETLDELKMTYDFIKNNPLDNNHIYILTPYPGTKLWEEAKGMRMISPEMDFGKLFVQLPAIGFSDFFKKTNPDLLKDRIFLNPEYRDNPQYIALIFKMLKLVYLRNLIYYLKVICLDPGLFKRIVFITIRNMFYAGKKILINGITLEDATLSPLLFNCRYWLSRGCSITFLGNNKLKKNIEQLGIITDYGFIEIFDTKNIINKFQFIFESLKRNLAALSYMGRIKGEFDIIYSISSVLDLVIFPYLLKKTDNRFKWLTVFDNTVPLNDPGNKFIRFLAWLFFRFSLFFLRRADKIFAISLDLKQFLLKNGFKEEKIVITGKAVEADIIRQSRKDGRYEIDALFVGRINETKGIYDMLKILEIVKKEYPIFRLAIMGDGDEVTKRNFLKRIRKMKLENNIQFLGSKTGIDKFNLIKSSKSFWFFSISESESFGVALLEAVCCGLPAFAYDLPPYKKIYKNNEVTIIEKNDYREAAYQIIKLFRSGVFENKNGELLVDRYNWDNIAEIEYNSFMSLY